MKHVGNTTAFPERERAPWEQSPASQEIVCLPTHNDTQLCLTKRELADSGYRVISGPDGTRVGQFGLCRDDRGEWVYPPPRCLGETVEDMLERNRQAKARMALCRRSEQK